MALFLFIVLVAVVCALIGVLVKGLFWLVIIACVVFVLGMVFGGVRLGRRSRR